jgi:hydrogenase maturation protease
VKSPALVIGVGNETRGDDGAGIVAIRLLRGKLLPGTRIIEASGEGAALMEAWQGAARVVLIDAVESGAEPGTIHRIDAARQKVPVRFFRYSTHAFSVAEAVETARALGSLPPCLVIYGIEGARFTAGAPLSREVESATRAVAARVTRLLRRPPARSRAPA